jgi:hypothetical protein
MKTYHQFPNNNGTFFHPSTKLKRDQLDVIYDYVLTKDLEEGMFVIPRGKKYAPKNYEKHFVDSGSYQFKEIRKITSWKHLGKEYSPTIEFYKGKECEYGELFERFEINVSEEKTWYVLNHSNCPDLISQYKMENEYAKKMDIEEMRRKEKQFVLHSMIESYIHNLGLKCESKYDPWNKNDLKSVCKIETNHNVHDDPLVESDLFSKGKPPMKFHATISFDLNIDEKSLDIVNHLSNSLSDVVKVLSQNGRFDLFKDFKFVIGSRINQLMKCYRSNNEVKK